MARTGLKASQRNARRDRALVQALTTVKKACPGCGVFYLTRTDAKTCGYCPEPKEDKD